MSRCTRQRHTSIRVEDVVRSLCDTARTWTWCHGQCESGPMAEAHSLFGDPAPLVFVTAPMTRLDARERSMMSFLTRTITRAIDEATREASEPWLARVYVPFE